MCDFFENIYFAYRESMLVACWQQSVYEKKSIHLIPVASCFDTEHLTFLQGNKWFQGSS